MIPLIFLKKQDYKAILIDQAGQSNMLGSQPDSDSAIGWITANHPTYAGLQDKVYILNSRWYPYDPPATSDFTQYNAGVNHNLQTGRGLTALAVNAGIHYLPDLQRLMNIPIHVSFLAVGGTGFYTGDTLNWNVNTRDSYYDELLLRIDRSAALMNAQYGVGNWLHLGIHWMQGENDNVTGARLDSYEQEEFDFFNALRVKYGDNYHFISTGVVKIGTPTPNVNNKKILNAAKSPFYHYINMDDSGDTLIHYTAPSQWLMGERVFNVLKTILNK